MRRSTLILAPVSFLLASPLAAQTVYQGVLESIDIATTYGCYSTPLPFPTKSETRPAAASTTVAFELMCKGSSFKLETTMNVQTTTSKATQVGSKYSDNVLFEEGIRNSFSATGTFEHPAAASAMVRFELPALDLDPSYGYFGSNGTCTEPYELLGPFGGRASLTVNVPECVRNKAQTLSTAANGTKYLNRWVEAKIYLVRGKDSSGKESDVEGGSAVMEATFHYRMEPADKPDLRVDHIEVVQVVQTPANEVPLVADKKTVARVFVKTADKPMSPVPGVTALLRAYRDGKYLVPSPLEPMNKAIAAPYVFDRDETNHSLNFELSPGWTEAGEITLEAELNPDRVVEEEEGKFNNNKGTTTAKFIPKERLSIAYVRVCTAAEGCPSPAIREGYRLLEKLYPVADGDVYYYPLGTWNWANSLQTEAEENAFLAALRKRHELTSASDGGVPDQLVGWLPAGTGASLGMSDPLWFGAGTSGRIVYATDSSALSQLRQPPSGTLSANLVDPLDPQFTLAHELGHNYGLHHPNTPDACIALDDGTPWPFKNAKIAVPGFDTERMVVIPSTRYELMSYCSPPVDNTWISAFSYQQLFDSRLEPQAIKPVSGTRAASAGPVMVISGWAKRDGSAGQLDPAYQVAGTAPASLAGGNHCLRFFTDAGPVADHCFQLQFRHHRTAQPLEVEYFVVKAPWPAGAVRVALVRGETELASLRGGGSAVTLSILSPQAGDQWTGRATTSWSASDAAGQPLLYTVQYSPDGGQRWVPLATDVTTTQQTVDSVEMEPGKQVMLRVLATNGLTTATATAGPIEVVAAPRMELSPAVLDFGEVAVGDSKTLTWLVDNPGSKLLTVSALTLDGAAFGLVEEPPFEVPPRSAKKLTARFAPTAYGLVQGAVAVQGDDAENPQLALSVKGIGLAPRAELTPSSVDFGEVSTGQTRNQVAVLRNIGSAPLRVTALSVNNARFSVVSPAAPLSLEAGAQQDLTLRFSPTATGPQQGILAIASNDPAQPTMSVELTGKGIAPVQGAQIALAPATLAFGTVPIGQTKDLTLTVSSTGSAALNVTAISSSNGAFRVISPAVPFTVASASSQVVTLRFTPTASTALNATLTVNSNDTTRPAATVALTGTGEQGSTTAGANIVVTPAKLDFGPIVQNLTRDLTLSVSGALGTASLVVNALTIDNPRFKVISPAVPFTVGLTGATPVTLRFQPTVVGAQTGSLVIASNAANQPVVTIPLSGSGVAPGETLLSVDDGTMEKNISLTTAEPTVFYVQRLTPPAYPATLRSFQLYFPNRSDGIPMNSAIGAYFGASSGGTANIDGVSLRVMVSSVTALGQWIEFKPSQPLTITSGDLVVGFSADTRPDRKPAALDTSSSSAGRAYVSTDGRTFQLLSAAAGETGNLMIRAVVNVGQ
jgi:hypothetical protein